MKKLYLIAGPNGAGKTTLANKLALEKKLNLINADEIALNFNKDPDKVKIKAGKIFIGELNELLRKEKSFILETTMSGKYLKKYITNAKEKGYLTILFYIFMESPYLCYERVKHRVLSGGHNVAKDDVIRRYYHSIKLFYTYYKDLVDICFLVNNSDDDFEEVALFQKGNITILNNVVYNKFLEVLNEQNR
jgi:predicted ABC-type ATPase